MRYQKLILTCNIPVSVSAIYEETCYTWQLIIFVLRKFKLLPNVLDHGFITHTHTHNLRQLRLPLDQFILVSSSPWLSKWLGTLPASTNGHILFLSQLLLSLAPMGAGCGSDHHRFSTGYWGLFLGREGCNNPSPKRKPRTTHISTQIQVTSQLNC